MHSIPPQMWSAFRASLNKDLKTSHSLPGLWITVGSKILEISGRTMRCPQDIPRVLGTSKPTWVRIADPNNPYTSLSKSSQQCLTWLVVLSALARSALGAATPAASTGCSGCVCRRRLGRDRGPCLVKPGQRHRACVRNRLPLPTKAKPKASAPRYKRADRLLTAASVHGHADICPARYNGDEAGGPAGSFFGQSGLM